MSKQPLPNPFHPVALRVLALGALAIALGAGYFLTEDQSFQVPLRKPRISLSSPRPPAPDFKWLPAQNHPASDIVLINFWAHWCWPCHKELPLLEELHKHYQGRDFKIMAVNMDKKGPHKKKAKKMAKEFSFPVVWQNPGELRKNLSIPALPYHYLIDQKGRVVWKGQGAVQWNAQSVQKTIDQLLVPEAHDSK